MLKIPTVYAAIAAITVMLTGVTLPPVLTRPIELMGNAAIPVMLLVLGMQLERAAKLERLPLVGLAVGLRLIVSTALLDLAQDCDDLG